MNCSPECLSSLKHLCVVSSLLLLLSPRYVQHRGRGIGEEGGKEGEGRGQSALYRREVVSDASAAPALAAAAAVPTAPVAVAVAPAATGDRTAGAETPVAWPYASRTRLMERRAWALMRMTHDVRTALAARTKAC